MPVKHGVRLSIDSTWAPPLEFTSLAPKFETNTAIRFRTGDTLCRKLVLLCFWAHNGVFVNEIFIHIALSSSSSPPLLLLLMLLPSPSSSSFNMHVPCWQKMDGLIGSSEKKECTMLQCLLWHCLYSWISFQMPKNYAIFIQDYQFNHGLDFRNRRTVQCTE